MSDMHVLTASKGRYRVVMHFPVPSGNNPIGTAWSTAIVEDSGFDNDGNPATPKTVLRTITAAEKTAIEAGTVLEHIEELDLDGVGQTTGGRRDALRARYTAVKSAKTAELQARYKFFGHVESEV